MIIPASGFLTLEEYRANSEKVILDTPRQCPKCKKNLWKHGSYQRTAKDLTGSSCVVTVPRLICSGCSLTISCLFDFLVPFKRYVAGGLLRYIVTYAQQETTYRDVAWGEHDGSNTDAEASLSRAFRAVAEACKLSSELVQRVQRACLEAGVDLMAAAQLPVRAANSDRAQSAEKAKGLELLSYAISLTSQLCPDVLQQFFWCRQEIFGAYHSGWQFLRLSAPQSLKQALF